MHIDPLATHLIELDVRRTKEVGPLDRGMVKTLKVSGWPGLASKPAS